MSPEEEAAYEAHLEAELARMCPWVIAADAGFDDPITLDYGAQGVIAESIAMHIRRCEHPWCVEQREDGAM